MFGWGRRGKNTVFLYFGVVLGLSRFVKLKVGSPTVDKAIFKNRISENNKICSIFRLRWSLALKLCEFVVLMSTLKPVNMSF